MDPVIFLIQVLNGIQYGLLLFLVASGLTLIFGIMGIINLAHGSFYMIGAYLAFSLTRQIGDFWLALAAGVVVALALGIALEWLVMRLLYERDHLYQVLLTYGLTGEAPHRIARLGLAYVPEGRGIFPNLSVKENLVMAARPGRWGLEEILEVFPRFAQRIGHGGGQLSGGEQQMLTIGRALMTNPELLILDEATEGLAPKIAQHIWAIVRRVRESGIATVIVDKNFKAVNAVTDRNVIIVKGRIVWEGAARELAAQPEVRLAHLGV